MEALRTAQAAVLGVSAMLKRLSSEDTGLPVSDPEGFLLHF